MCIICLQFQRDRDFVDAKRMIEAARREILVIDIEEEHLSELERNIAKKEKLLKNPKED